MARVLLVLFVILMMMTSQSSYADVKSTGIVKLVWNKGDSWKIKCPVMSYHPSVGSIKAGEYTVVMSVLGIRKNLQGIECYVLEIRPGDNLTGHMLDSPDSNFIEHIFYKRDTLELIQIEKWQIGKDGKETSLGRGEVSTARTPLSIIHYERGNWIPILLPQFPLTHGKVTQICRREYKELTHPDKDIALSFSGDSVVEDPTGKDALLAGSIRITFYATKTYTKSGDHREKRVEQIWQPGKPWWSIARLYNRQEVLEFTLVE